MKLVVFLALALVLGRGVMHARAETNADPLIERVSTKVPFPRGLAVHDGTLHVLCRGRVRSAGGVSATVDDQAGTIYVVDPDVAEPIDDPIVGAGVAGNGTVLARPTSPPFLLWDREAAPPERDRLTDRPYCTLRYHDATQSFYVCAFSGVDKAWTDEDPVAFSKNLTDAILRYDLRTRRWSALERHDREAGGSYPHHDPAHHEPPHGWLNGPDNCLPVGHHLYAVAKDNSILVAYDLRAFIEDPDASPPGGHVVLDGEAPIANAPDLRVRGHSAIAVNDGWLYIAGRTSSVIARLRIDEVTGAPVLPVRLEAVARFDPYDPATHRSANITDVGFDDRGRLYVISAQPMRIYRFEPDAERVHDFRDGRIAPWVDFAERAGMPRMKGENVLFHEGWLYVTSGDGYVDDAGAQGTVYRVRVD